MTTIPLDEAIDLWRPREVRQLQDAFGKAIRVNVHDGLRNGELLFDVEDPFGPGPRAEAYLYEATGGVNVVDFTVLLRAVVPRAVPRRVHLWGVDLRWADGVVGLLDTATEGGAVLAVEGPVLRPGVERLVHGGYEYRRRSNPFRVASGQTYGAA
ncbi:MAG: hypothetical protein H5T80_08770, partial [Dietzia sp.]|nr:hypothetical protein [Dietzia sp.]